MTVTELLAAENSGKQYGDPNQDILYQDPNGVVVIYASRPVALVADGDPVDLGKMKVKIADFGKGPSFMIQLTCSRLY